MFVLVEGLVESGGAHFAVTDNNSHVDEGLMWVPSFSVEFLSQELPGQGILSAGK